MKKRNLEADRVEADAGAVLRGFAPPGAPVHLPGRSWAQSGADILTPEQRAAAWAWVSEVFGQRFDPAVGPWRRPVAARVASLLDGAR